MISDVLSVLEDRLKAVASAPDEAAGPSLAVILVAEIGMLLSSPPRSDGDVVVGIAETVINALLVADVIAMESIVASGDRPLVTELKLLSAACVELLETVAETRMLLVVVVLIETPVEGD